MGTVKLVKGHHRGKAVIGIHFKYNAYWCDLVRQMGASWSNTHQCWYLPERKGVVDKILQTFKGVAWVDYQAVLPIRYSGADQRENVPNTAVDPETDQKIQAFADWMRTKRYSEKTIQTYRDGLYLFFGFMENKDPEEVINEDLERFHKEYIIAGGYSQSFQSQVINAVKLFFTNLQNRQLNPELVERPKKEKKLPNVLSKDEVKRILEAPANLKHRTMLSMVYGCGLRRSELLALKLNDVDSSRKLLIIRQAKGRKDRLVPLSEMLIDQLRAYYKAFKPKTWLFEGQQPEQPYSENSLRNVLKHALRKAGIQKPVTLHWLRHSYATHLLEAGTDIRYIQEILGHKSSQTTEIYTHVSTQNIQQIKSPIEDL